MKVEKYLPVNARVELKVQQPGKTNAKKQITITVSHYQAKESSPDNFYKPISKMIKIC